MAGVVHAMHAKNAGDVNEHGAIVSGGHLLRLDQDYVQRQPVEIRNRFAEVQLKFFCDQTAAFLALAVGWQDAASVQE